MRDFRIPRRPETGPREDRRAAPCAAWGEAHRSPTRARRGPAGLSPCSRGIAARRGRACSARNSTRRVHLRSFSPGGTRGPALAVGAEGHRCSHTQWRRSAQQLTPGEFPELEHASRRTRCGSATRQHRTYRLTLEAPALRTSDDATAAGWLEMTVSGHFRPRQRTLLRGLLPLRPKSRMSVIGTVLFAPGGSYGGMADC